MLGVDGFLLVYAINSRDSFCDVRDFYDHILRVKSVDKVPAVVAGNKCDLGERQRKVTYEEGLKMGYQLKAPFFETSAKFGINIDECFYQVVREILKSNNKRCAIL